MELRTAMTALEAAHAATRADEVYFTLDDGREALIKDYGRAGDTVFFTVRVKKGQTERVSYDIAHIIYCKVYN